MKIKHPMRLHQPVCLYCIAGGVRERGEICDERNLVIYFCPTTLHAIYS